MSQLSFASHNQTHLMPLTVFIADDHRMLVAGMRQTLEEAEFSVVGEAYCPAELVESYFTLQPDVLLIDIRFEHSQTARNGLDVCADILERNPAARIVVCSQFDSRYFVKEALRLGVTSYVCKSEAPAEIVAAVRAAANGDSYVTPMTAEILGVQPGISSPEVLAA